MALLLESWRADGKGQSRIDSLRSDARAWPEKAQWVAEQRRRAECVLITRRRTDKQNPIEKIVWQRPGYVDPCRQLPNIHVDSRPTGPVWGDGTPEAYHHTVADYLKGTL